MEGFNVKDKSLLENKEFLQELMERIILLKREHSGCLDRDLYTELCT